MQPENSVPEPKSLAEQRLDLERLQFADPQRYALQSTQDDLENVIAAQLERDEIDEQGRTKRNVSGEVIPHAKRRDR